MFNILFLLCFHGSNTEIKLSEPIFLVEDMAVFESEYYVLDRRSYAVAKIGRDGTLLKKKEGRGRGPGEFNIPRSIAVSKTRVFVTDYRTVHIFDRDLNFIKRFTVPNNPRDAVVFESEVYISTVKFPGGKDCIYVYSDDGVFLRKFYQHNSLDSEITMPFLDIDEQGMLYVQAAVGYGLGKVDKEGNLQSLPDLPRSPRFKDFLPFEPFSKKHGKTRAAVKKWRTQWSEPDGVAIIEGRYLVYSFKHLEDDLISTSYFLEGFDLKEGNKVLNWKSAPGKLISGGKYAYFFVESEDAKIEIVSIGDLVK